MQDEPIVPAAAAAAALAAWRGVSMVFDSADRGTSFLLFASSSARMNDRLAAYLHVLFAPATLLSLSLSLSLSLFTFLLSSILLFQEKKREREREKRKPRIHFVRRTRFLTFGTTTNSSRDKIDVRTYIETRLVKN